MKLSRAPIAIAVVSVLLAGCGASSQDGRQARRDAGAPPQEPGTATHAPVVERPQPTCAFDGTDPDFHHMRVRATFTNPLGDVNDLKMTYAFFDRKGGTRFYTGTAGGLDLSDLHFP